MGRRKSGRTTHERAGQGDVQRAPIAVGGSRSQLADRLRPWLLGGVAALFVARLLFPSESAAEGDGLPIVMLWIALSVFWLLGVVGRAEFRVRFGWIDAAVLVLVGWHTIAAIWAAGHASPRPAINMGWEWIGMGLSFFLARQFVVGDRERRAVAAVMIGLAVGLAGYGLYQYYFEMPATRAAYEADPDQMLHDAWMWMPPDSPERAAFEKRLASVEPIATFALTNSLAGYLAPWLVVVAGIAIATLGQERKRRSLVWLLAGIAACVATVGECVILTKSRSAYLATATGFVLLGCWAWRRNWIGWRMVTAAVIVLAVLVGAAAAVRGVDAEVVSEAAKSLGYRFEYWRGTAGIIADHPLVGCGPGNFQAAYTRHKLPEASEEIAEPHNFLLEVWATAGTPAALALIAVLGIFVWRLLRSRQGNLEQGAAEHGLAQAGDGGEEQPFHDRPWAVILGGGFGFFLAIPVVLVGGTAPDFATTLICISFAAATAGLLWDWIVNGQMPRALPAIGLLVLLINLLAAGGIGFPGVAASLWLLIVLALNGAQVDASGPNLGGWHTLPRWAGFTLLGLSMVLAVACYLTAYGPVPRSKMAIRAAITDPDRSEQLLLTAAKADPLAAEPYDHLASLAFAEWQRSGSGESLVRFGHYSDAALSRAPDANSAWLVAGDRYLQVFAKLRQPEYVRESVDHYRRAVALYPNSSLHRAKLAVALAAAGEETAAREETEAALRLDNRTPHDNKKLPIELRNSLERSILRQR